MKSTPKWNEELPLRPKAPLPPPRRFEIVIDGGKPHVVALKRVHFASAAAGPRVEKSNYEIKGTSLREDELMEYAADTSKDALIIDGRGGLHRPGETFLPRNKIMSIGDAFFPPTYVGEHVPTFKPGIVVSRAKLAHLVRTGQLKKPPNMVNSFPPDRIRRRKRPFPPGLAREAIALSDPGAYHGLAISPSSRVSAAFLGAAVASGDAIIGADGTVAVRDKTSGAFKNIGKLAKRHPRARPGRPISAAFLRAALKNGTAIVGADGSIYMRNQMGLWGKIKKAAKGAVKVVAKPVTKVAKVAVKPVAATARVVAKPVAATARVVAKPVASTAKFAVRTTTKAAKKTVKFAKKNAMPIAMTAALGPAGLVAYGASKVPIVRDIAKWSGKQLAAAAKAVARLAATPIRLAVRPAVNAAVKRLAGGRPATPQVKAKANALVIAKLKSNANPLAKFAGLVLSYVGTGVSGVPTVGLQLLKRDTAIGRGLVVGCTQLPGQAPTVMGMTGAEISAMAASAVAAITPIVKKMVAEFAISKAQELASSALSPRTEAAAQPPEVATTPDDEPPTPAPSYPPASAYDGQSASSVEEYEQNVEPVEEPSQYAEQAEATDDTSGLISYGWAR